MFEEEGYKLVGGAFEVYNQLGYGMAEEIYQQSLEIELTLRGIPFQSKEELAVFYKDRALQTHYKPDLFVFNEKGLFFRIFTRRMPGTLIYANLR